MGPLMAAILPSLITAGGGLLGGIFGGKAKSDQSTQEYEQTKKLMELRKSMAGELKPRTPRFESYKDSGAVHDLLLGLAGKMMGQWGGGGKIGNVMKPGQDIDLTDLLGQFTSRIQETQGKNYGGDVGSNPRVRVSSGGGGGENRSRRTHFSKYNTRRGPVEDFNQ